MKSIYIIALLFNYCCLQGQSLKVDKISGDYVGQNKIVNNNIIKVGQGNTVIIYNLDDSSDRVKLIKFLGTIPKLSSDMQKVLSNTNEIIKLIQGIKENNVLNTSQFLIELEKYIRENENLRNQIAVYKSQATDQTLEDILEKAENKLINFDNSGYQELLENFKISVKNKIEYQKQNYAFSCYFQARNNILTRNFQTALEQIDDALEHYSISIFLELKAEVFYQLNQFEESIKIYKFLISNTKTDTTKISYYGNIATNYTRLEIFDKALLYTDSAISLTKTSKFEQFFSELPALYSAKGTVYNILGDYILALKNFKTSLNYLQLKMSDDTIAIATIYHQLGTVFNNMDLYDSSIHYSKSGIDLLSNKFNEDDYIFAMFYNTLGYSFRHKGDSKTAVNFFLKALLILQKFSDQNDLQLPVVLNNVGFEYQESGKFDSANYYYHKALNIRQNILGDLNSFTAYSYNNIGTIFLLKKVLDSAKYYYQKVLNIRKIVLGELNIQTANTYKNIGVVCEKQEYFDSALFYYKTALDIQKKTIYRDTSDIDNLFFQIGFIYILLDDKKQSKNYFDKYNRGFSNICYQVTQKFTELFVDHKYNLIIKGALNMISLMELENLSKSDLGWLVVYMQLGSTYNLIGEKEKARVYYDKALDLKYSSEEADLIKIQVRQLLNEL